MFFKIGVLKVAGPFFTEHPPWLLLWFELNREDHDYFIWHVRRLHLLLLNKTKLQQNKITHPLISILNFCSYFQISLYIRYILHLLLKAAML